MSVQGAEKKRLREMLSRAKSYEDLDGFVEGIWNGDEEMKEITRAIEARRSKEGGGDSGNGRKALMDLTKLFAAYVAQQPLTPVIGPSTTPPTVEVTDHSTPRDTSLERGDATPPSSQTECTTGAEVEEAPLSTPPNSITPDLDVLRTPRLPLNELRMPIPAGVSGRDALTPSPTPPTSQGKMLA